MSMPVPKENPQVWPLMPNSMLRGQWAIYTMKIVCVNKPQPVSDGF